MSDWCDKCSRRSDRRVVVDPRITIYLCEKCHAKHRIEAETAARAHVAYRDAS